MKKKILIVDDEPDVLEVVGMRLRQAGYDVCTASSGKTALELAVSEKPSLIILDVIT